MFNSKLCSLAFIFSTLKYGISVLLPYFEKSLDFSISNFFSIYPQCRSRNFDIWVIDILNTTLTAAMRDKICFQSIIQICQPGLMQYVQHQFGLSKAPLNYLLPLSLEWPLLCSFKVATQYGSVKTHDIKILH